MKNRDGFCMKYDITNIYEILYRRKISHKNKLFIRPLCIFFLFLDYTVLYKESTSIQSSWKGHPYENIFQSERYT